MPSFLFNSNYYRYSDDRFWFILSQADALDSSCILFELSESVRVT
jgi:hypothetical protein